VDGVVPEFGTECQKQVLFEAPGVVAERAAFVTDEASTRVPLAAYSMVRGAAAQF
jgi:hypothetical protein